MPEDGAPASLNTNRDEVPRKHLIHRNIGHIGCRRPVMRSRKTRRHRQKPRGRIAVQRITRRNRLSRLLQALG